MTKPQAVRSDCGSGFLNVFCRRGWDKACKSNYRSSPRGAIAMCAVPSNSVFLNIPVTFKPPAFFIPVDDETEFCGTWLLSDSPASLFLQKNGITANGSRLMKLNDCLLHILMAGALNTPASEKWQPLVYNEALRSWANEAEISAWIWAVIHIKANNQIQAGCSYFRNILISPLSVLASLTVLVKKQQKQGRNRSRNKSLKSHFHMWDKAETRACTKLFERAEYIKIRLSISCMNCAGENISDMDAVYMKCLLL